MKPLAYLAQYVRRKFIFVFLHKQNASEHTHTQNSKEIILKEIFIII